MSKTYVDVVTFDAYFAFRNVTEKLPDFSATFLQVARFPAIPTEKTQETLSAETPRSLSWYLFHPAI